jgi:hypothetical protein
MQIPYFFQIMGNVRRNKNFIHSLQTEEGVVTSQADKHRVINQHFSQHMGSYVPRSCSLNLSNLGWHSRPLQHLDLDDPIQEQELQYVIKEAPKEKAPGPDDFIGAFFSLWWSIVKQDLMLAVNQFFSLNQQGLHLLN